MRRAPGRRVLVLLCLFLCSLWVAAGAAAQTLPEDAARALEQGREAAEQAREVYAEVVNHPDQALWREALQQGRRALELAPEHPEALRFLAETYSFLRWDVRAWSHWTRYLDVTGELDEEARQMLAKAGNELGYARYQAGDMDGAIHRYREVLELTGSRESLVWLARIYFEVGDLEGALPYWEALVEQDPDDRAARYYLERTRQRIAFGTAASDAFHTGIIQYEAGQLDAALDSFEVAASHNPGFKDAHVWAGRTAFELGRPDAAERHWQRVQELDPADERAEYFVRLAERQRAYGAAATLAFYDALVRYEAGDLAGALEHMQRAVSANPDLPDAIGWVSRLFAELERPQEAMAYWQELLAQHPDDERIEYHLELARDQLEHGVAAASALARGLRSYQLADFEHAREAFEEAVEANPAYAEAWGWLARVAFDQGQYAQAADHYRRAADLEPDNEAYRFFAEEAARLAQPAAGGPDD